MLVEVHPRFVRQLSAGLNERSNSDTLRAVSANVDAPPAHVVGTLAGSAEYASQLGMGAAAPMQSNCWMPPGKPVFDVASASSVAGRMLRNLPIPPRN